jgi:hypothetical protein
MSKLLEHTASNVSIRSMLYDENGFGLSDMSEIRPCGVRHYCTSFLALSVTVVYGTFAWVCHLRVSESRWP